MSSEISFWGRRKVLGNRKKEKRTNGREQEGQIKRQKSWKESYCKGKHVLFKKIRMRDSNDIIGLKDKGWDGSTFCDVEVVKLRKL